LAGFTWSNSKANCRGKTMSDAVESEVLQRNGRNEYVARLAAIEIDLAVIHAQGATKDDLQLLRNEMRVSHERILALLHEHKLQVLAAMGQQRDDFNAALSKLREDFNAALSKQREDFNAALSKLQYDFNTALLILRDDLNTGLSTQRYDFTAALSAQREDQHAALAKVQIDLHKSMMSHMWKLYGFASMMLAGVYFIARYVH
jgi:DNA anti-recombination protein RmuC